MKTIKSKNKYVFPHITKEELEKIQQLNGEFQRAKIALGDLEIQKQNILRQVDYLKAEFASHEKLLVEKYGSDSIINVQTGEITKKKEQNEDKKL